MGGTSTTSLGTAGAAMDTETGSSFASGFGGFNAGLNTASTSMNGGMTGPDTTSAFDAFNGAETGAGFDADFNAGTGSTFDPSPSSTPSLPDISTMQDVGPGRINRAGDVVAVDSVLKSNGIDTSKDFTGAIKQGQQKLGVKADGWVGPKTRDAYQKATASSPHQPAPVKQQDNRVARQIQQDQIQQKQDEQKEFLRQRQQIQAQKEKEQQAAFKAMANQRSQQSLPQQKKVWKTDLGTTLTEKQMKQFVQIAQTHERLEKKLAAREAAQARPAAQAKPTGPTQPGFKPLPRLSEEMKVSQDKSAKFIGENLTKGVGDSGKHSGARAVENFGDQGTAEVIELAEGLKRRGMADRADTLLHDTYNNIRDPKQKERFKEVGNRWLKGEDVFGASSSNRTLKGGASEDNLSSNSQKPKSGKTDRFDRIYTETERREGKKYTNYPDDPAGPTKYGVSIDALTEYHQLHGDRVKDIPKHPKDLTAAQAKKVYKEHYYDRYRYGEIRNNDIAEHLYDISVLPGPDRSARWAQETLNEITGSQLKIDGTIGSKTLAGINNLSSEQIKSFMNGVAKRRENFFRKRAKEHQYIRDRLPGYLNRTHEFRR